MSIMLKFINYVNNLTCWFFYSMSIFFYGMSIFFYGMSIFFLWRCQIVTRGKLRGSGEPRFRSKSQKFLHVPFGLPKCAHFPIISLFSMNFPRTSPVTLFVSPGGWNELLNSRGVSNNYWIGIGSKLRGPGEAKLCLETPRNSQIWPPSPSKCNFFKNFLLFIKLLPYVFSDPLRVARGLNQV